MNQKLDLNSVQLLLKIENRRKTNKNWKNRKPVWLNQFLAVLHKNFRDLREREREREREKSCFRFERRDFDFENALKPKVVKPKTPTVTLKISNLLSLCWGRSPKTKQSYYDLICSLQFLFAALAQLHILILTRETKRGKEYWRGKWKSINFIKRANRLRNSVRNSVLV